MNKIPISEDVMRKHVEYCTNEIIEKKLKVILQLKKEKKNSEEIKDSFRNKNKQSEIKNKEVFVKDVYKVFIENKEVEEKLQILADKYKKTKLIIEEIKKNYEKNTINNIVSIPTIRKWIFRGENKWYSKIDFDLIDEINLENFIYKIYPKLNIFFLQRKLTVKILTL